MSDEQTRRVLKGVGVAVTTLEDAIASGSGERARKAEADLRARMVELLALVERLAERAASL
jgi:hypothetical protein